MIFRRGAIGESERSELANPGGAGEQAQHGAEGTVLRDGEEAGAAVALSRGERPGKNTRIFRRHLSVRHLQSARAGKPVGEPDATGVLLRTQRNHAARQSGAINSNDTNARPIIFVNPSRNTSFVSRQRNASSSRKRVDATICFYIHANISRESSELLLQSGDFGS